MTIRVLLLLLLLPLLGGQAVAQESVDEEIADVRRYSVEMIIFSYAQEVSTGTEIFVADAPASEDFLSDDFSLNPIEPIKRRPRAFDLVSLAAEDYTMNEIYDRMRRLNVYKPLMHFGWTQSTFPEEDSVARPLSLFARPPRGLGGELTLYLSRYLHLAVNLQLDGPTSASPARRYSDTSNNANLGNANLGNANISASNTVKYRIEENRIMRNGELRYFDHPKFGVLAKITRIETEEEEDGGEDEFLGDIELGPVNTT